MSQLKQAAAYPLVITVFGKRNGWIEKDLVEKWVTTTIDILFKIISIVTLIQQNSSSLNLSLLYDVFCSIIQKLSTIYYNYGNKILHF